LSFAWEAKSIFVYSKYWMLDNTTDKQTDRDVKQLAFECPLIGSLTTSQRSYFCKHVSRCDIREIAVMFCAQLEAFVWRNDASWHVCQSLASNSVARVLLVPNTLSRERVRATCDDECRLLLNDFISIDRHKVGRSVLVLIHLISMTLLAGWPGPHFCPRLLTKLVCCLIQVTAYR
jgi:hypothetical protein